MRKLYLLTLLSVFFSTINGQSFTATYDFVNVTTSTGVTDPSPVPVASGLVFGSFNAVGTPANPNAGGRFSFTDWSTGATNGSDVFSGGINTSEYYQVTITPNTNVTLDINTITFTLQRSGTGIRQYSVRGSVDGYANNLPASINPANTDLSVVPTNIFQVVDATTSAENGSTITLDATYDNLTAAVTFRFYGYNAEASGGSFSIDNVVINGVATYTGVITNYYSKPTGNLTTLGTWGTNTDGTGTPPVSFTGDGSIFNVVNRGSTTLDANLVISGSSSKVVTGDGITATELIIPNTASLVAFVDVTNLSTLRLEHSTLPTLGTVATGSTINYAQTASPYTVPTISVTYHHLKLTGGIKTFASGTVNVNGSFEVDGVTGFNGSGSPFTTMNLFGNFTLSNGAAFEPIVSGEGNRMTVICLGSGTQTFSGGDFYLFRLRTPSTPVTTLNIAMGASSNLTLANPSGGGLDLQQVSHTLSLNGNDLTLYGAGIFSSTHTGTISGNLLSDITINKTSGFANIGSTGFTIGSQVVNNLNYYSDGLGSDNLNLLSNLFIAGNLTMTAGLISLGTSNLEVNGTASGLANSYVQTNGTGSLILNNVDAAGKTFPIGNSTYNPLTIANGSNHNWTVNVNDAVSPDPGFTNNGAVNRVWNILPSVNPPSAGATLTFQYDTVTDVVNRTFFNAPAYNTPDNVQVWHRTNGYWLAVGTVVPVTGVGGNTVTSTVTGVTTFSPFGISRMLLPLPVKLISFTAVKVNDRNARINWELAACCSRDARFELEKSTDGIRFQYMTAVAGSETNRFYEQYDINVGRGITYYRLKATDVDGKVTYSRIVAIINGSEGLYVSAAAPNPVKDATTVVVTLGRKETVAFTLTDASGRIARQWQTLLPEGNNTVVVPVQQLSSGIYFLSTTAGMERSVIRFVKE